MRIWYSSQRWWERGLINLLVIMMALAIFTRFAFVDGSSMWPLRTGDLVIFGKYLCPYVGATVLIQRPVDGHIETLVKLVVQKRVGSEYRGKIIHKGELAVEGTDPYDTSENPGIIPRKWIKGVALIQVLIPWGTSTAERADGPKPKLVPELPKVQPQLPHNEEINGKQEQVVRMDTNSSTSGGLSVAGDLTSSYKPGLFVYDKGTGGCYRITRVSLSEEPVQTVVEVEPPFSSPVIGQAMYLLDHKIAPGPGLDATTLRPTGPIGPAAK